MNTEISTRITINGEQVQNVVIAGNVPEMSKTIDFKVFETRRQTRKIALKRVVKNEQGLTH